jgi:hypothetical protein
MLGGLPLAALWIGLFAIVFSDILRNDMNENPSARRKTFASYEVLTFWVSLVAALAAVSTLGVSVWAWLYPNEPVPQRETLLTFTKTICPRDT